MKRYLLPFTLVLLFASSSSAVPPPLTRGEAIRTAFERNPALKSVLLDSQAAAAAVGAARGLYDPRLELQLQKIQLQSVQNVAPLSPSKADQERFNFSFFKKLPSGADLVAEVDQIREENPFPSAAYDPSWRHEFQISLTQPLLRGGGRQATEEPILLAAKGRDSSHAAVLEAATLLVGELRTLFADLRHAGAILSSRRTSVRLAETILSENQAKVEAGLLPPLDLLEAEVALKSRQRELLEAEQNERELLDRLAEALNLVTPPEIVLDDFQLSPLTFAEEADLAYALTHRPDLRRASIEVESRRLEAAIAAEKIRPALDLVTGYSHKGLGGDYGQSLERAMHEELQSWSVGLSYSHSFGNHQAEGDAIRKKYLALSAAAEIDRLRELVRRELRTANQQIRYNERLLQVASDGVVLAAEKLKNLLKRREVGLATTRAVFEGEADLARSQSDRATAETLYSHAVTSYLIASGKLLDDEGIRFVSDDQTPTFVSGTAN